jgi:hypothetical protein
VIGDPHRVNRADRVERGADRRGQRDIEGLDHLGLVAVGLDRDRHFLAVLADVEDELAGRQGEVDVWRRAVTTEQRVVDRDLLLRGARQDHGDHEDARHLVGTRHRVLERDGRRHARVFEIELERAREPEQGNDRQVAPCQHPQSSLPAFVADLNPSKNPPATTLLRPVETGRTRCECGVRRHGPASNFTSS